MGADAKTALAVAVVPFAKDSIAEETLYQILAGAVRVLNAAGCLLVGGHSTEGPALSLGRLSSSFLFIASLGQGVQAPQILAFISL